MNIEKIRKEVSLLSLGDLEIQDMFDRKVEPGRFNISKFIIWLWERNNKIFNKKDTTELGKVMESIIENNHSCSEYFRGITFNSTKLYNITQIGTKIYDYDKKNHIKYISTTTDLFEAIRYASPEVKLAKNQYQYRVLLSVKSYHRIDPTSYINIDKNEYIIPVENANIRICGFEAVTSTGNINNFGAYLD